MLVRLLFAIKCPCSTSKLDQVYLASRLFALGGVCAQLVGFNLTSQYNCQAWIGAVLVRSLPFYCQWGGEAYKKFSDSVLLNVHFQLITHLAENVRDWTSQLIISPP